MSLFKKFFSNFFFAASFHRLCVYLCLDFRTKQQVNFWPWWARHGNISFILTVTRLLEGERNKFSKTWITQVIDEILHYTKIYLLKDTIKAYFY